MIQVPTYEQIRTLFQRHLEEHLELPESARVRDLHAEQALIREYSGRVLFELIQNALDRAERSILVDWRLQPGTLVVANDGLPVTAYDRPKDPSTRLSDLHALLSLH